MVKIRLKRTGSKFNAKYQIVVADARAPRDGRFIEKIGHYNPQSKELVINEQLKTKWLNHGAKPTETVKTLFKKHQMVANKDEVKKVVIKKVSVSKTIG